MVLVCHVISQDHVKGHVALQARAHQLVYLPVKFGGHMRCDSGDAVALVCHVISQDHMRLYRQKPIKVNYHPAKIYFHRQCGSGDIIILVCHVITLDHVTRGSCDFMDRTPSR